MTMIIGTDNVARSGDLEWKLDDQAMGRAIIALLKSSEQDPCVECGGPIITSYRVGSELGWFVCFKCGQPEGYCGPSGLCSPPTESLTVEGQTELAIVK